MLLLAHIGLLFLSSRFALAQAVCQNVGLDYLDGGSYLVDGSADGNFSFASEFQGSCNDTIAKASLRGELGTTYGCSSIATRPIGSMQISTCDISYSDLTTGNWQIVITLSPTVTIIRTFRLTVAAPSTVVTTITPTVLVGTTVTPPPKIITAITQETRNLTLRPATLTSDCRSTRTTTTKTRAQPIVVTETSTVLQTTTDQTVTRLITVLSTRSVPCKSTTAPITPAPTSTDGTAVTTTVTVSGSTCVLVGWGGRGWAPPWRPGSGWGPWRGPPAVITGLPWPWNGGAPPWVSCGPATPKMKRTVAAMAAITSSFYQTTYTVTRTTTVYLPTATVTQYDTNTVLQTITPAPNTICVGTGTTTKTVTSTEDGQKLTIITVITSITHITETVLITLTQLATPTGVSC